MAPGRDNLADEWPPLRTLTDIALRRWHVKLTCPDCQRVRVLSGGGLWYLFYRKHWSDDVRAAARRLYCGRCWADRRVKIVPQLDKTNEVPTGAPLPEPPDYEWKKLIARYRS